MATPPWPLYTHGLAIGEELDEHTRRRLRLELDPPDDLDKSTGSSWWSNPDDSLWVAVQVHGLLVGLVNLRSSALLDGFELIGESRDSINVRLGQPSGVDPRADSLSFDIGAWTLEVGFDEDCVDWVTIFNGDVLDDP